MALDERDGGRLSAASTAEAVAAMRAAGALERDPAVRNPDHLAHHFVPGGLRLPALVKLPALGRLMPRVIERMAPGAYCFETARTKHLDAVLRAELGEGLDVLVLLGAGYDSRPYRMGRELAGVRVLEVDHPAMSAIKQEKVRSLPAPGAAAVTYVAVDFARDDLPARLAAAGHDLSARTLFVWSGVTPYIPETAVRGVLGFVASHSSPRTSIAFDYCYREMIEGDHSFYGARELLARVRRMGEPLVFGIPRGGAEAFVASEGLGLRSHLGEEDAVRRHLIRSDGTVHGRPYGFGGFVHAGVSGG